MNILNLQNKQERFDIFFLLKTVTCFLLALWVRKQTSGGINMLQDSIQIENPMSSPY